MSQAAELDPRYAEPHYALARMWRRGGDTAKADRALEKFLALKKQKEGVRDGAPMPPG